MRQDAVSKYNSRSWVTAQAGGLSFRMRDEELHMYVPDAYTTDISSVKFATYGFTVHARA